MDGDENAVARHAAEAAKHYAAGEYFFAASAYSAAIDCAAKD